MGEEMQSGVIRRTFLSLLMGLMASSSIPANAGTFSAAVREIGNFATAFGAVIKKDFHPENVFIPTKTRDCTAGCEAQGAENYIMSGGFDYATVFFFGVIPTTDWSGSCVERTGAACSGYYDDEGYKHLAYGLYVPASALAEIQNDVANSPIGESIQASLADKNTDPNAIFDGEGKKIVGNYAVYMDQGSGLLLGFHPLLNSVLISNVEQQIPDNSGWKQETVYQGINNIPLNMYTYAPATAWKGVGS
ncbi:hypothetical protein [Serratia nevei]|uniref:hypothetical protein n=1 Tax=Serratia nevei TaxID=2703794 RepID=UPI00254ED53A|nr:hypothetical protein [Serratia nevei]MDK5224608.1 hypothetical protein [Serratia nevei]